MANANDYRTMRKTTNPILALVWYCEGKGDQPREVSLRQYDGRTIHDGIQLPEKFAVVAKSGREETSPCIAETWEQLGCWLDEVDAYLNQRAAERLDKLPKSIFPFRAKPPG